MWRAGRLDVWPLVALAAWLVGGCSSGEVRLPAFDDDAGGGTTTIPAAGLVATLSESASTNTRSLEVLIYGDGSASRALGPPTYTEMNLGVTTLPQDPTAETFPAGSSQVQAVLRDLAGIGDVAAIPVLGFCSKSASFGTTTRIQFNGSTSGDLQCIDTASSSTALVNAARQLYQDCGPLL